MPVQSPARAKLCQNKYIRGAGRQIAANTLLGLGFEPALVHKPKGVIETIQNWILMVMEQATRIEATKKYFNLSGAFH